jgi:5-hydroxyisourate hydrolase-like protein (transthyretin family)
MDVLYRLFSPDEYLLQFIFAAFLGVLVPIIIVTVPKFRNINSIAVAATIAVAAMWVKRYLIIIPTLESPLLPLHDLRPEYAQYSATWVEWGLTFAGIAMFILLFYLFSKFIPILPVVRTGEEKDYSRLRKIVFEKQMKQVIREKKKSDTVVTGLLILLLMSPFTSAFSQEGNELQTVLKLEYFHIDSTQKLTATLRSKESGKFSPVEGMEITFKYKKGDTETALGTASTNKKGKGSVEIPGEILTSGGDKGIYSFEATFAGKDKYPAASGETSIKPLRLEMSFNQQEADKVANLKAFELDASNNWVPVENLDIQFYVPRTFSLMNVGKSSFVNGLTSIEFPTSVPGNQLGYLTLLAKIEDNEQYGNVEVSGTINWGKPLPPANIIERGLGDTDAPLWMVYTLIVLLSLVWFHYMYVIFTVFRIRHLGKS